MCKYLPQHFRLSFAQSNELFKTHRVEYYGGEGISRSVYKTKHVEVIEDLNKRLKQEAASAAVDAA